TVTDAATGHRADGLPGDPFWRGIGATYVDYYAGQWGRDDANFLASLRRRPSGLSTRPGPWHPPDFGPGTVRVAFELPTKLSSLFVLDPVQWNSGEAAPLATFEGETAFPWSLAPGGLLQAVPPSSRADADFRYEQVVRPDPE